MQKESREEILSQIREVMNSPGTSYWLVGAIQAALDRDPVDAYRDALHVAELFGKLAGASLNQELPVEKSIQMRLSPSEGRVILNGFMRALVEVLLAGQKAGIENLFFGEVSLGDTRLDTIMQSAEGQQFMTAYETILHYMVASDDDITLMMQHVRSFIVTPSEHSIH